MAGNFKYHIKNEAQASVWVVMDTERENQRIDPGVTVIFQEANKLDNPTFRAYAVNTDGSRGNLLFTDTFFTGVSPLSWSRHLKWTGSRIEDA